MSNNLLKAGWVTINPEDKRIIDSNRLMAAKMESKVNHAGETGHIYEEDINDGFSGGLDAEQLDGLLSEDGEESVVKAQSRKDNADREALLKSAEEELALARMEIAGMKEDALADIEVMKRVAAEEARGQGYAEGFDRGMEEIEKLRANIQEDRIKLQQEYDQRIDELEPLFVDLLTGIYQQVFQVELKEYGGIVTHLITNAIRNSNEAKDFIVHVSKEDYEYVAKQREGIRENISSGQATLEIIEDITLSAGDCIIETGGGVFDCGLGTQLSGLSQKLKLLSFQK